MGQIYQIEYVVGPDNMRSSLGLMVGGNESPYWTWVAVYDVASMLDFSFYFINFNEY